MTEDEERIEREAAAAVLVPVRCVVESEPWADGKRLLYWQDYDITIGDAKLLEDRKFVVILKKE